MLNEISSVVAACNVDASENKPLLILEAISPRCELSGKLEKLEKTGFQSDILVRPRRARQIVFRSSV